MTDLALFALFFVSWTIGFRYIYTSERKTAGKVATAVAAAIVGLAIGPFMCLGHVFDALAKLLPSRGDDESR